MCYICLESLAKCKFTFYQVPVVLRCRHEFHPSCLLRWAQQTPHAPTCPLCRDDVVLVRRAQLPGKPSRPPCIDTLLLEVTVPTDRNTTAPALHPDLGFYDSDSTVPMDDFDTDEASDLEADSDASTIPWSDLIGLPSGTDDDADP